MTEHMVNQMDEQLDRVRDPEDVPVDEKHLGWIEDRCRDYGTGMNPIVVRPGNTVRFAETNETPSLIYDCRRLAAEVRRLQAERDKWYQSHNDHCHMFRVAVDPTDSQKLNPIGAAKLADQHRTEAAAAHDLLAACETLLEEVLGYDEREHSIKPEANDTPEVVRARAAIAKAKGGAK